MVIIVKCVLCGNESTSLWGLCVCATKLLNLFLRASVYFYAVCSCVVCVFQTVLFSLLCQTDHICKELNQAVSQHSHVTCTWTNFSSYTSSSLCHSFSRTDVNEMSNFAYVWLCVYMDVYVCVRVCVCVFYSLGGVYVYVTTLYVVYDAVTMSVARELVLCLWMFICCSHYPKLITTRLCICMCMVRYVCIWL